MEVGVKKLLLLLEEEEEAGVEVEVEVVQKTNERVRTLTLSACRQQPCHCQAARGTRRAARPAGATWPGVQRGRVYDALAVLSMGCVCLLVGRGL